MGYLYLFIENTGIGNPMNPLVSVSVRPPELAATDGTYRFVAIGAISLILFVVFLLVSFTLFFCSAASCEFCRQKSRKCCN